MNSKSLSNNSIVFEIKILNKIIISPIKKSQPFYLKILGVLFEYCFFIFFI